MKKTIFKAYICLILICTLSFATQSNVDNILNFAEKNISWLGQASIVIKVGSKYIYIDPFNIKKPRAEKADLILITHPHFDHLNTDSIKNVMKENTVFYGPVECFKIFRTKKHNIVQPGFKAEISGISIIAVPAYNIVKNQFHAKEKKWVGYIIIVNGIKIYIAGDTERIPEMASINSDISILPLGQTYTMGSLGEAVLAAVDTKAKVIIPYHYGGGEGTLEDAKKFCSLIKQKGLKCILKQKLASNQEPVH